ncbi:EAL domain-containing protein [Marinobacterium sp. D7]|uniref:putative bifunctional diguanylate cyclase/phosphodiesterase n=1 Tax=Marinobacterium ramblicola TaxID=2849041 RepID=UPI001C2DE712|nr:bifunctional diguanylate cyclase/phosphodiesterase [Marinobacterium ramblicola]MBV1790448.1 EAL domain-containing protein [Marinobacterium ramblicola]
MSAYKINTFNSLLSIDNTSAGDLLEFEANDPTYEIVCLVEEGEPSELYLADMNYAAAKLMGIAQDMAVGRSFFELWPLDESRVLVANKLLHCLEHGETLCFQVHTGLPDGRHAMDISLIPLLSSCVGRRRILMLARDIAEQRRQCRQLDSLERVYRTAVDNTPDTIVRYDRNCRRIYANRSFIRMCRRPISELLGKTPLEYPGGPSMNKYQRAIQTCLRRGEAVEVELRWRNSNDSEHCSLVRLTPEHSEQGEIASVLAVGRDITNVEYLRKQVHHLSNFDTLSGLPNRDQFYYRLHEMITIAGARVALIMLDLDRFRVINDSLGHSIGDVLLHDISGRLLEYINDDGFVARLGGDEFAILVMDNDNNSKMLKESVQGLMALLAQPFQIDEHELRISVSMGIALYPDDGSSVNELIKFADSALHHVKECGRNGFGFYDRGLTIGLTERMLLEGELHKAVQRTELELYYQPKIDRLRNRVIGCEALLRWHNPRRGLLTPDNFISIAEETGIILELGEWVLRTACAAAVLWNHNKMEPFKVAVNLSARQFVGHDLLGSVQRILAETCCRPEWIELEITESLLLDDRSETRKTLDELHALGFTIAIDDFGTAYSALNYFSRFPIDVLKIDRSFVQGVEQDSQREKLLRGIVALAHCLEIGLVAEGVETQCQADYLCSIGCHIGQGYLFARPMPALDLEFSLAHDQLVLS